MQKFAKLFLAICGELVASFFNIGGTSIRIPEESILFRILRTIIPCD
jgi:hypothetical protein